MFKLIKNDEKIKDLEDLAELPRGTFLAIRGNVEKILEIKPTDIVTYMTTIRPELKRVIPGEHYEVKTYYEFCSKEELQKGSFKRLIVERVGEEYFNNLKKEFN
jgi:hypothetical protein